jgi:hypothetical protein
MKRIQFYALLVTLMVIGSRAYSQTDSVKYGWTHSLGATLNLSQVSFKNWEQGGDDALSYSLLIAGKSIQDMPMTNWATTYNFAYGEARLNSFGLRKADDKIDLATQLTYKLNTYVNPYASLTFLSQFTTGYKYIDTSKTAVSGFLDPAYVVQSMGFGYQPSTVIKTRLGLGLRETFTQKYLQYSNDPNTLDEKKVKIEGGLESVTEFALPIDSMVFVTSKLQLFAAFKTMDRIVVRSDNAIVAKVSKYINTSFILQLIEDPVVSPRTQIKEGLALGLSYVVF